MNEIPRLQKNTKGTFPNTTINHFIENYNIADAIYGASLLHACINRGDIIRNTGIYHLINVMGNYRIDRKKIWKTPTTLVLELFTKYHKGVILESKIKTENFISPTLGKQPIYKNNKLIDAAVTKNNETYCISIVNKSENKSVSVKLNNDLKITKTFTINGSNKTDMNDYKNINKVKIKNNILKAKDNHVTIPAHSINMILLRD